MNPSDNAVSTRVLPSGATVSPVDRQAIVNQLSEYLTALLERRYLIDLKLDPAAVHWGH